MGNLSSLERFCRTASQGVMMGLWQELGLEPKVHYRPQGYNGSRVLTLRLLGINPHYLPQVRRLADQLGMWAGLSDREHLRVGWAAGSIAIEIPKPAHFWKQVTIETLVARRMIRRGPVATLGMSTQDRPMRIDFAAEAMAHTLIAGQTRSGKTNTQKVVAWNLAHNVDPVDVQLVIFDVAKHGFKWRPFDRLSHLAHPLVTEIPEADGVLTWAVREIERRAIQHRVTPRLFFLVDEVKALIDDSAVAGKRLARIASIGGEFGLHLVLATQYPQVNMLGGSAELKRNVNTRLCGRVDDATSAANALGIRDSGAEALQGYGDFLLRDLDGLSRLTVAKLEDHHAAALLHSERVSRLDLPPSDLTHSDLPQLTHANSGDGDDGDDDLVFHPQAVPPQTEEVAWLLANWPQGIHRIRDQFGIGTNSHTESKTHYEP